MRVESIVVHDGRVTLYYEGADGREDYYPAAHNVSQAKAGELLTSHGRAPGCHIEAMNYRNAGEPLPPDHRTAARLAKQWRVRLQDNVRSKAGGRARGQAMTPPGVTYLSSRSRGDYHASTWLDPKTGRYVVGMHNLRTLKTVRRSFDERSEADAWIDAFLEKEGRLLGLRPRGGRRQRRGASRADLRLLMRLGRRRG